MSSGNFLQRFKGKTQQIGKQGIRNALGDGNPNTIIQTNTTNKYRTTNNSVKPISRNQESHQVQKPPLPIKQNIPIVPNITVKKQNPFLVSNPFYLDQEERQREQQQKKLKKMQQAEKPKADLKATAKNSTAKSLEKKTIKGEWSKLGGLGANIGGEQWIERKKKLQKMQEFADQVKSINSQKIKPINPDKIKEEKKQPNTRQKALQYSKNVPRPPLRRQIEEPQQIVEVKVQRDPNELTQLELYQAKHQKLKHLVKNHY